MSAPQSLPHIFTTEEIVPTMERILSQSKQLQDAIVQTVTPSTATFANVMQPLAQLDNDTTGDLGVIWMLQYAAPDKATQENGGLYFNEEELDGVPLEEMKRWKDEQPNPEEPLRKFVPFANGGTVTVLTYAHNADTRKRMFLGDQVKLVVNVPLLQEIAKKRQLQASMLGYASHADFRLERRLVKTLKWVEDFLTNLSTSLQPLGRKELDILQRRRLKDFTTEDDTETKHPQQIPPWDLRYYQNIVEKEARVDHTAISEFFPLEPTAAAMLESSHLSLICALTSFKVISSETI